MTGLRLTTVNINAPDPAALARFYQRLFGWQIEWEEPGFVVVRSPDGSMGVSCQQEDLYVAPVWPARPGEQQMQLHLEIRVDDLAAGVAHAVECGAKVADFQPQDGVRVCLDPAGHPFCLYLPGN